jgi:glycerophosphoryl diester phosphodiesterase
MPNSRTTSLLRPLAVAVVSALIASPLLTGPATAAPREDSHHDWSRSGRATVPALEARAALSADYIAPGPPSGAQATPGNGRSGPFPGQVIPGFSAMVENGDGTFWGMPDNGFGAKTNSADFLLRIYLVKPRWETARGGAGAIKVRQFISLRDQNHLLDFPIVHENTHRRLLTGADFDIESLIRSDDGTFWIGEEFGPFLLHFDATGLLLSAPVKFPGGKSPANPYLEPGEQPNVPSSRGFEAMARSEDGDVLYPIVEGALVNDSLQRRRLIYEFDTRTEEYTGRSWQYETDQDANVVGDAFTVSNDRLLVIERDDFEGSAAVTKRLYEVNLRKLDNRRFVTKKLVVDLLKIANPHRIGTKRSPDSYGVGNPFSFPMQSVETVLQLHDGRILVANDNNYPGNDARVSGTPDDTEMIVLNLRSQRRAANPVPVVGHRGASGYRPEHTLASYELAINQCADYIEPDLVATKDGQLVARHENEIGGTTDVAAKAEFAGRRTTKVVDGVRISGWFTEDFTLAELKTLRAKERIPQVRPDNTAYDGLYQIPTFEEVVDLARHSRTCSGGPVGVYPETKHPSYFDSVGLSLEEPMLEVLNTNGLGGSKAPVVLQSFETANLVELAKKTDLPIAQLIDCSGAPYDLVAAGDRRTYADLVTRTGLKQISRYADIVGFCKNVMIPRGSDGSLLRPTAVISDAHRAGLTVHGWTFRQENQFLPTEFRRGTDPKAPGDMAGEVRAFLNAGMDGFFTDDPDVGVDAARNRR